MIYYSKTHTLIPLGDWRCQGGCLHGAALHTVLRWQDTVTEYYKIFVDLSTQYQNSRLTSRVGSVLQSIQMDAKSQH